MPTKTLEERLKMLDLNQRIAVEVKHYGPTDYRPSRIRISLPRTCSWEDTGPQKRFISRDSVYNSGKEQAAAWIKEQTGLEPSGYCDMGETDVLLYQWFMEGEENNWVTLSKLIGG